MFRTGLTSITFRKLLPDEIIRLSALAKLDGIEWGGDVHVLPGDITQARQVGTQTRDAGLCVSSYGSYYCIGQETPDAFLRVLDSAVALEAPIIRVWAGKQGSREASAAYRRQVVCDSQRIADLAHQAGLRIACEWHGGTLTDNAVSAKELFDAVNHPAFCTYWQPRNGESAAFCLYDMDAAMERLIGLHVFSWNPAGDRLPLSSGQRAWKQYLAKASAAGDMFALLEFVLNDDPHQMLADAATLREWVKLL